MNCSCSVLRSEASRRHYREHPSSYSCSRALQSARNQSYQTPIISYPFPSPRCLNDPRRPVPPPQMAGKLLPLCLSGPDQCGRRIMNADGSVGWCVCVEPVPITRRQRLRWTGIFEARWSCPRDLSLLGTAPRQRGRVRAAASRRSAP